MQSHQVIKLNMINKFRTFLYLIKYFLLRNFVRKYKISSIQNYGFVVNDYLVYENKLDLLFKKYGSDKGGGIKSSYLGWYPHNYSQLYHEIFFKFRNQKFNFLEVGIGSINQSIKSALPLHCKQGASLRAFQEYFPKAQIYGCDIDKDILFKDKRILTFYLDQTSKKECQEFFFKLNKKFTIIIDDGLHEFNANIILFQEAINYLNLDGIYIIEDVNEFKIKKYYNYFSRYKNKLIINFFNIHNSKFLGRSNNFIMIRKITN